jgi:hypothetical protein
MRRVNEYIQKWVDLSVTLDEWQQHKSINLDEEIEHFEDLVKIKLYKK